MKNILLTLVFIFTLSVSYSQEAVNYFSDAIRANISNYKIASNKAYEEKDFTEGQRLFDSLVNYKLVGTQFDDFTIKGYNTKDITLSKIEKPVLMVTYASWCLINDGEIPALNKLAKDYRDEIQLVVLFWDEKSNIKKIAGKFSGDIKVCYANENYSNDARIVATLKHTLGLPTTFLMDENKKVLSINRITSQYNPNESLKNALSSSYAYFRNDINKSLFDQKEFRKGLVVNVK